MEVSYAVAAACKHAQHALLNFQSNPGIINMEPPFNPIRRKEKEKVVLVMGVTGTGKSRLSIDLANRFPYSEIVNSDKMQVYKGLEIVTNKVTKEEQQGFPHHLLGEIDPDVDFSADDFRRHASHAVESIVDRNRLPIIVGGSNSFIEALVDDEDFQFRSKYECCFLWVDVSIPVLHSYVSSRVNRMVESGLVDEVRGIFKPDADYGRGIRKAIGVPELDQFLRAERAGVYDDESTRRRLLGEAIEKIKSNTCMLALRQVSKIRRLQALPGWYLHQLNATEVFLKSGRESDVAWEKKVVGPSTAIVRDFLRQRSEDSNLAIARKPIPTPTPKAVVVAVAGSASNPPGPASAITFSRTAVAAATR